MRAMMNPDQARFPVCITWTQLPLISWIIPCIGHTGICKSDGVISDFAGPYYVSEDDFAFGSTIKYVQLEIPDDELARWNDCVEKANKCYRKRMHNICCDNCHSHCARALNYYKYLGKEDWTMISIWWMLITQGRYVSWGHAIKNYIGFAIFLVLVFLFTGLPIILSK